MSDSAVDLMDLVFVDEPRLQSYVEQTTGPLKREKLPTLGFEWSLLGPKVSGSQAQQGRPHTTHEKIRLLLDDKRIINRFGGLFVGSFYAFRAVITTDGNSPEKPERLAVWACWPLHADPTIQLCSTFMIEDAKKDATDAWSGYSALGFLFDDAGTQNKLLVAAEEGVRVLGPGSWFGAEMNFLRSPKTVFENWGARIGPLRSIDVLYRVRATMVSDPVMQVTHEHLSITFGYPVCIIANPSALSRSAVTPPSHEAALRARAQMLRSK